MDQQSDLAESQGLILDREHQQSVKKSLNYVLADDGIALDPERMPIDRLGDNRCLSQLGNLAIDHSNYFELLGCQIDDSRVEILRIS